MKPIIFETFRKFGDYEARNLTVAEPWCFNGGVGIHKYRVTIEEIKEPKEVLEARLRKLRKASTNHHDWEPLQRAATKLGISLTK